MSYGGRAPMGTHTDESDLRLVFVSLALLAAVVPWTAFAGLGSTAR